MTPPAAAAAEALPRRRTAPRRAPVRHPRRISVPARPARPAQPGRPARAGRGSTAPVRSPRPATHRRRPRPRVVGRADDRGLALRAVDAYERVCDSTLVDRLVRGRLWIGVLAFSLIGIVAMQLMVLELNGHIGASLKRAAALQRANAQLGIEAATGAGEGRIEPLAAATGMTFAPSGSVHFVASSPASDVRAAAAALAAPIQPREYAASGAEGSEAPASSSEGASGAAASGGSSASSGETASGQSGSAESGSGGSEASGAPSGGSEAGGAGSGETSSSQESHGTEAGAATAAGASETSAGAAGGVAAGH